MGGGNGAKSASKRERNAKAKGPEAKSILKEKAKMMSQMCMICRATFMCTAKRPELEAHASTKHPKDTLAKCFPTLDA
ncbi:duf1909-domain-containing protein [Nannochloropsis oceanica]